MGLKLFFLTLLTTIVSFAQIDTVWIADDGERIKNTFTAHWARQQNPATNTVWYNDSVHLEGAANEVLAFQISLVGGTDSAKNCTVTLDSLYKSAGSTAAYTMKNTGTISDPYAYIGKVFEFFVIQYMTIASWSPFFGGTEYNIPERTRATYNWNSTSRPWDQYGSDTIYTGVQAIPEILVPFQAASGPKAHGQGGSPFVVPPKKIQGVWVDVLIPRDALPGDYYGSLKVYYNTSTLRKTIPVKLHVYNFALPDTSNFYNGALLDMQEISGGHGLTNGSAASYAMLVKYQQFLYRHRVNGWAPPTPSTPVESPAGTMRNNDTTWFSTYQASVYDGTAFTTAQGYAGPGLNTKPNYYQIGGFQQPASFPGLHASDPWSPAPTNPGITGGNYYAIKKNAAGAAWSSSAVSYAVNDMVFNSTYPYWWYCKLAHVSSTSRVPGTTGGNTYWAKVYDRGGATGFALDPDTTKWRTNYWNGANFYVRFFNTYNPTARLRLYGPEEPNIEGGYRDTSAFADINRKIRWLQTNPSGFILKFRTATTITNALPEQWKINRNLDVLYMTGASAIAGFTDSLVVWQARGKIAAIYSGGSRPQYGTDNTDAPATDERVNPWILWKYRMNEFDHWLAMNFKYGSTSQINPWNRDYNYGGVAPSSLWNSTSTYAINTVVEYVTYPHFFKALRAVPANTVPVTSTNDFWSPMYQQGIKMGDGTLVYQGTNNMYPADSRGLAGPVAGIKLKNLRRGIQDFEYLFMAKARGIDSNLVNLIVDTTVVAGFDKAGSVLNNHWPPWDPDIYHARRYENSRKALGRLIESYSAAPPAPGQIYQYRRWGRKP